MRFLSRLWWFDGTANMLSFGHKQSRFWIVCPLHAKAMAHSNMSQLKMLSDQQDECIFGREGHLHGRGVR
jgi:hypothetical protein